jgi:hypothetical protein
MSFSAAAPSISKNIHYNSPCSEGDEKQQKMQASSAHHSHAKALCSFAFAAQTDAPAAASTYTDIMIEVQRAFPLFTFATKDSSL